MSQPEKFLERWSRRKREAADPPPEPEARENKKADADPAPAAEEEKPFDLDSLPSLESIGADTDLRDFLRPDVPEELRHEALRRAWAADPGVRDFVELLENGWDFNDPNAMAGFGPIEPGEVARLMAQFDLTAPEDKPEEKKVAAVEADKAGEAGPAVEGEADVAGEVVAASGENAAVQNESVEPGHATSSTGRKPA